MLIEVSNEWYEQQQEVWRGVTIIKLHYNQITILANSIVYAGQIFTCAYKLDNFGQISLYR